MQLIANGPDIPDALLQAHEDGQVVFFCGAGISYPAGLPNFRGLVDKIYDEIGTPRTAIEEDAYGRGQYDATLDLLERRVPGQRLAVRSALANVLQPKLRRRGATDTHSALLQLAGSRDGAMRLVTTNFDRVFEHAARRSGQRLSPHAAPMLPVPKNSRWDGLVYLHGVLPAKPDDGALHRLVVTSGDFGNAYLTERWAARFVSELFRNYVVCFVGYSISDPVLRYMMDALAADRMLGESTPQAYALGECEAGEEEKKRIEWEAKGVTPVLYNVPAGSGDHSALHDTLKTWARVHSDGVLGKERIVVSHALGNPTASTQQDDFVGRMLWALSDESGLPAKRFANFNPVPPLSWLDAFSERRYGHADLARFGVPPRTQIDEKLRFSLVHRPSPYTHAPAMSLVADGASQGQWDRVMFQLARWLVRHLNDPALLLWFAQRGCQLHDRWLWLVEHELDRFARLEGEGDRTELDRIRAEAPNAVPSPAMRVLWRLVVTGRVKGPWLEFDIYRWHDRLKRDGLTSTLRFQFRALLAPRVVLKKPFRWWDGSEDEDAPERLKQLVAWELVLSADHAHSSLRGLTSNQWRAALPAMLEDLQQLLRDALDLLLELGESNDHEDRSFWDLPSIAPHWQNRGFRDWVVLIELLRDAWLDQLRTDPPRAQSVARTWFDLPYPTFKRLALFAASQDGCVPSDEWVNWLVGDDAWWLWSVCTQREVLRLLVLQGPHLAPKARGKLERAVLAGPPRHMYVDDLEPGAWRSLADRAVWLRLAKLEAGARKLGPSATARLKKLSAAHPQWALADNESDEFSHWMSGTGDPDYDDRRDVDIAPQNRQKLIEWLKQPPPEARPFYEDTWRETCGTRLSLCLAALWRLAKEGVWPAMRWREALQAWSAEGKAERSWRYAAALVESMPDEVFGEVARVIAWWLDSVAKVSDRHEKTLLKLCRRILQLQHEDGVDTDDPVTRAINHPVGHVTQALLSIWFRRKPSDGDLLPGDIEPFFTQLCATESEQFRHGRVLLASRLIPLFRVDRAWTDEHLLPLFDWSRDAREARAAWEGFLWAPRLYRPLLIAFKDLFLNTAHHYADLGDHGRQYAAFLVYASLDPVVSYHVDDLRSAFGALPQQGLREAARALAQALEGAGDQREEYWRNRVLPFWQQVWPKERHLASNGIAASLAELSIAAREEFPAALAAVLDWLQPLEHPHYVVHLMHESDLAERFPEEALRLLNAILDDQCWTPRELGNCLADIAAAAPPLAQDPRYQRLLQAERQAGG